MVSLLPPWKLTWSAIPAARQHAIAYSPQYPELPSQKINELLGQNIDQIDSFPFLLASISRKLSL